MEKEISELKTIRTSAHIGRGDVLLERDLHSSDTYVSIGIHHICCIAWEDRYKFLDEINEVINKYRK